MWQLIDKHLSGRLLLGTALYPSLQSMQDAIISAKAQVITVSIKRQTGGAHSSNEFWNIIKSLGCYLLPNTAGCLNAQDAVETAKIARELFDTNWIKLETIGDTYTLQPHPFELVKAAKKLIENGFEVFPYCTDDLIVCQRLIDIGCKVLMPWAAPIGSGKGLINLYALQQLRDRLPEATLIIDAGLGKPSHAVQAMELGYDGILLNSAIALAGRPSLMAAAFRDAVIAGRAAFKAGLVPERDMACPSTPLLGSPFWHQESTFL